MPTPNSVLIIGAGIAGLTIAEQIIRHQQRLAVTIVGATDERAQRVSFWRDRSRSSALTLPGAQSWSAWSFNTPKLGFSLQRGNTLEYVSFDARSYKAHLTDSLQQAGVRLIDDLVKSVQKRSQGFHVETSQGPIEADVVIDTQTSRTTRKHAEAAVCRANTDHPISARNSAPRTDGFQYRADCAKRDQLHLRPALVGHSTPD